MTVLIEGVQRPARGETICGDDYKVIRGSTTTVAIADGLGHGPEAAKAARAYCEYISSHPSKDLAQVMRGASKAISGTRGAAAGLLRINESSSNISFVGIGNIEIQAVSQQPIRFICTPGIVGRSLRKVVPFESSVVVGDLITLYSDGISRFSLEDYKDLDPAQIVQQIVEKHGKNHDDATCIVIRFE